MSAAEAYDLRYAVTFSTALIAAVLAGVASQPGDTLLSMVNKRSSENVALATAGASFTPPKSSESPDFVPPSFSAAAAAASKDADLQPSAVENNPLVIMSEAAQELGVSGLFKGMTARLFHVSFIIVVQLLLYDVIKQLCGIPVTGMHH